jgi:hypothetical protein
MHKSLRLVPDPMAILRRKFHLMEAVHQKKALRKKGFPQQQIAYGVDPGVHASVRYFLLRILSLSALNLWHTAYTGGNRLPAR